MYVKISKNLNIYAAVKIFTGNTWIIFVCVCDRRDYIQKILLHNYNLMLQIQRLNLSEEDFEYEHQRQMLKRKAAEKETANRTD